jgi:UDPglucose 6-dehydrogenase
MNITVVGSGYVGLSNALILSQRHRVYILDIVPEKIEMLKRGVSPLKEKEIEVFLNKNLNRNNSKSNSGIIPTTNSNIAYKDADYIIIATPTNYDAITKSFDTSSIESVISEVRDINQNATIVIKSTVPVGFTSEIKSKYSIQNLIFSPEFLREGKALHDSLYPSRIIIGEKSTKAEQFGLLLKECSLKADVEVLLTDSIEAEAVKLFSNTYLAMRVAFFNELDSFAEVNNLNSKEIIEGVSLDPRIGMHYNNPSFGYGGYCLPKDTKQLLSNFDNVPNSLITAIVESNIVRKKFIADSILSKQPKIVGIYRLIMKDGSDNFRSSAIQDVLRFIEDGGVQVFIYEPLIKEDCFGRYKVTGDLAEFKKISDIIITNRMEEALIDVKQKIYTRDLFNID